MTACIACGGPTQSSSRSHMIRFSSTPSHSLPDSHQLVCSTSAVTGDWRDAVTLREDGWIVGPNDRLLLWVPKPHREWLYYPRNTLVFPRGHFELDLSNMAHGKSWQLCQGGQG
ncbi:hypothetical protein ID866_10440 [Astraeus odoratus]|nr:hypothetical protein ID866_10440 [Astraeus odoratus]